MRVVFGLDWIRTLSGVVVWVDSHYRSLQFGYDVRRDATKQHRTNRSRVVFRSAASRGCIQTLQLLEREASKNCFPPYNMIFWLCNMEIAAVKEIWLFLLETTIWLWFCNKLNVGRGLVVRRSLSEMSFNLVLFHLTTLLWLQCDCFRTTK